MSDQSVKVAERTAARAQASVGELLGEVSQDLSKLLRQEVELAKAELRQEAKTAGTVGAMFGGAGVAGFLALLFLSTALWGGLSNVMDQGWAALKEYDRQMEEKGMEILTQVENEGRMALLMIGRPGTFGPSARALDASPLDWEVSTFDQEGGNFGLRIKETRYVHRTDNDRNPPFPGVVQVFSLRGDDSMKRSALEERAAEVDLSTADALCPPSPESAGDRECRQDLDVVRRDHACGVAQRDLRHGSAGHSPAGIGAARQRGARGEDDRDRVGPGKGQAAEGDPGHELGGHARRSQPGDQRQRVEPLAVDAQHPGRQEAGVER